MSDWLILSLGKRKWNAKKNEWMNDEEDGDDVDECVVKSYLCIYWFHFNNYFIGRELNYWCESYTFNSEKNHGSRGTDLESEKLGSLILEKLYSESISPKVSQVSSPA